MPDARERVVAAFADRPDDDRHGPAGPFDVQGRVLQAGARYEEQGTEVGVRLRLDADRLSERSRAEQGEIGISRGGPLAPEVLHVVPGVEGVVVLRAGGDVGGETSVGRLAFREVPERDQPRGGRHGRDAFHIGFRVHERNAKQAKQEASHG